MFALRGKFTSSALRLHANIHAIRSAENAVSIGGQSGDRVPLVVVEGDAGARLDKYLQRRLPGLPYSLLHRLLREKEIRVDDSNQERPARRAEANERITPGSVVWIPARLAVQQKTDRGGAADERDKHDTEVQVAQVSEFDRAMLQSRVLYKDKWIMVIDKPSGLAVQGGTKVSRHIDGMLDALRFGAPERPRLVHRLDKDASGVLVLARSLDSCTRLQKIFASEGRALSKVYWAFVTAIPVPKRGTIRAALEKTMLEDGEKVVVREDTKGTRARMAVTRYDTIDHCGAAGAWLRLEPRTGRTHQLRVHCADVLQAPIVGDYKYGPGLPPGLEDWLGDEDHLRLHLHARRMVLPNLGHPGRRIEVEAPLPVHMKTTWDTCGFDPNVGDKWERANARSNTR